MQQSLSAANHRNQEEEKKTKRNVCTLKKQLHEKHKDEPSFPRAM